MKYLLNISTGVIHDADNPCYQGRIMNESNKKIFDTEKEAVNYYEGNENKGRKCGRCFDI